MRIAHFVRHSIPWQVDGYSIRTQALLRAQRARGHTPVVVTAPEFGSLHGAITAREVVDDVGHFHRRAAESTIAKRVARVPVVRRLWRAASARRYYSQVLAQCAPVDLLHVHMQPRTVKDVHRWRERHDVPLVYEVRGVWEDSFVACGQWEENNAEYRRAQRESTDAARSADWVITISNGLRDEFISRGVPRDRVSVVPNGVDTRSFNPLARDRELARQLGMDGKTVFGYVSSLRELEGVDALLQAMPHILRAQPNSSCLIVGEGSDKARLESIAASLGVRSHVVFTGRVPHASVCAYYSLIDVFVVPRPPYRVNELVTPLKPLEAMSMAKALLVSDVGGLKELVEDDRTGVMFQAGNAEDLAQKAIALGRDEQRRLELGARARAFVQRERDWNVVTGKYEELSRAVVERHQRRHARQPRHTSEAAASVRARSD